MDLLSEHRDSILRLTLHRPAKANTLTPSLRDALCAALRHGARDPGVAAVVLDALPGKTFCGGVDLTDPDGLDAPALAERRASIVFDIVRAMLDVPKPVVAAVGGAAVGGGCIMAMLADRIVCSPGALLSLPEITLGMPSFLAAELAAHRFGPGTGMAMVLVGDTLDAAALARHGALRVDDDAALTDAAWAEAVRLAALPPQGYAALKAWMREPMRFRLLQAIEKTRARNAQPANHAETAAAVRRVLG
jgi:enoyl-CoA hydratase/carnithine racemase